MEAQAAPLLEATEAMIQAIDQHLGAELLDQPLPGSICCPFCYENPAHIEEHLGKFSHIHMQSSLFLTTIFLKMKRVDRATSLFEKSSRE